MANTDSLRASRTSRSATGLGLATVRGTVRKSAGFITIESAGGKGTSTLYFPKAITEPIVVDARPSGAEEAPLGAGELILVVEDNENVRVAPVSRLESLGYIVLQA